jgi:hypothetical protein
MQTGRKHLKYIIIEEFTSLEDTNTQVKAGQKSPNLTDPSVLKT